MTHEPRAKAYACGVQTAWSAAPSPGDAVRQIAGAIDPSEIGQLLVFFSPSYAAEELASCLSTSFRDIPFAGCSTAGEITPAGFTEGSLVVLAFPRRSFRFVSDVISDIRHMTVERGAETVHSLRTQLDRLSQGGGNRFALSFIDGLSKCEEIIVSALGWALNDIPLVGGSAGDNLELTGTTLLHNGHTYRDAAALILVETDYALKTFKHDHFEPTQMKLVVTASDNESRTVWELNAEPAAAEYAASVGIDHTQLTPMSFASHPVVVRIGGDYYCRSIQKVNPDGSLSFFCAIDDGVVLTVARPRDMVSSVTSELDRLNEAVGGLDFVLAFECVLRRLDAENRQVKHQIAELYRAHNVVGFHTYGEQYGSMHLNQTFTGIAIGRNGASRC